ncbi:MAG TPA: 1-deoxy-D-xylulose-5-phosphate reductoisomerase [Candidatus Coprenecus stercoravium]|uniref:1-deoxy-D-xylulose 5-phosphate reductoisomerase n=1 Tax=Candidatus Coprenecus stercoravium TaxID=2840735 RepID=A0A9D2GNI4_9BACT|nr:1-deoxy-D-xylulose-5-phosphate reductoisomerase [Candidatus Coprenecus stercoravium]
MEKRRIAILGSTGSIGTQALDVVREHRDLFDVQLLTACNNSKLLIQQAIEFHAACAVIANEELYDEVFQALDPHGINVFAGMSSIIDAMASSDNIDLVLSAMVGFRGLEPTLAALRSGKAVAIANKEPLVAAGKIVMETAREHNAPILPVDSEHSAIFQALQGEHSPIERIFLTASGGPFLRTPVQDLARVTVAEAVNHPRWKMGHKISVDSATLMNKGFEMIEACWLFGVDISKVTVVIHPQSVIHSMVSFEDGAVMAQMSMPDMRLPIQYALTYPERLPLEIPRVDFFKLGGFTFSEPDTSKFPCLEIAVEAMRKGGNIPCAMNAANEVAVNAFINGQIRFTDIPAIVRKCVDKCDFIKEPDLNGILDTDRNIRELATRLTTGK